MMDRVLCSRAREVGGCRHVPRGARRTNPQTMESQAKADILVELLIMGARYMISSPMSDNIVV